MSNGHRGQVHVRFRQPAGALASLPSARASRVAAVVLVLAALLVGAADAQADTGVIPDTPDLPWTDPDHRSPLEVLSSQIASQIAGREVRVYCNGQNDWDILRAERSIPENVWGYVANPEYYYVQSRTWVSSSPDTKLAPIACQYLWSFAKAPAKPTKCDASRTVTTSRTVTVRYKTRVAVKVTRRVKVNGVYVKRRVTVYRQVWRTRREQRTATTTVPLGRVPCYSAAEPGATVAAPAGGEAEYRKFVSAIMTLAHESIHLFDGTAGGSIDVFVTGQAESRAECLGMQNIARVAVALGDTQDDAAALATYYALKMYPDRKTSNPDYWSPDCVQNGRLDQTPGDGIWP